MADTLANHLPCSLGGDYALHAAAISARKQKRAAMGAIPALLPARSTLFGAPNGTVAKLRAAPHASGDAARPLPRLKMGSAGVSCNGRDAVAHNGPRRFSAGPAYRRFDSFS